MKKFKENLESRKDENIASTVLMILFTIFFLSFYGAFYVSKNSLDKVVFTANSLAVEQNQ